MDTVNIGYNNSVMLERIVAVINAEGNAARKLRTAAYSKYKLVEATKGKKTRSMIVMDSGHLVLSILTCETLNERIKRADEIIQVVEPEKVTVNINGINHEI
ncbi:hypothetical protein LCGC14_1778680 [marine sediment metagenome]|uniref:DUF370 domain-containing protein n=1 Tax=marine sediment metagenome TaxID=412755 RepID=A0A0F9JAY9_9ZZZZ